MNDLVVSCRIVSMQASLSGLRVRVEGADKNFTLVADSRLADHSTEMTYPHDSRYVINIHPAPLAVRICTLF